MQMFRVKAVSAGDMPGLVAVWRETWPATYLSTLGDRAVEAMLLDLDLKGATSLLPEHGAQGLCLVHGDEVIGTTIYSLGRPAVYLWAMYVSPRFQRRGAGSLLLEAVRSDAGLLPIEVRVLKASSRADSFYRKHGFEVVGHEETEIIPGVKASCLVMRWTPGPPRSSAASTGND
jgi:GNAT superfamily N-acetyltransferase